MFGMEILVLARVLHIWTPSTCHITRSLRDDEELVEACASKLTRVTMMVNST